MATLQQQQPLQLPTAVQAQEPVQQSSLLADSDEWDLSGRVTAGQRALAALEGEGDQSDVESAAGEEAELAAQLRSMAGVSGSGTNVPQSAPRVQHQAGATTFVKEADEIASLLQRLHTDPSATSRLCAILDEYQEACELLDPHLPHMLVSLMNFVHSVTRPGKTPAPVPPLHSTTGAIRADVASQATAAAAQSSSSNTPAASSACPSDTLLTRVFKVVYTLSKVRGYKTLLPFFPHEVADLEPTLRLLQSQRRDEHDTWETRYGLLLWLSIIVLIPFDLNTVDSSMTHEAAAAGTAGGNASSSGGLISTLISLGSSYLSDPGAPREAASVLLAKLFSRVDMHASHLGTFLRWSLGELARIQADADARRSKPANVFLTTGIFRTLVSIFRYAPRDVLLSRVHLVAPLLSDASAAAWAASSNTLIRKLFVKLSQRVGLTYLPVRVASWRYQRGQRSLLTNLQKAKGSGGSEAAVHNPLLGSSHHLPSSTSSSASSSSASTAAAPSSSSTSDSSLDDNVPSEVEDAVQILLDGLRDKSTVVRWSSAKGVGRLTNCLSADFGDDVVAAVLELFSGREGDAAWHGGCLALAELARRGLLLPSRLAQVVPITLQAVTYDKRTAAHSVGANVRDAACYVLWAFARAYAPDVLAPYLQSMASGLITLAVFDREVNVRRASSAAFQEHVGRQGSASFPHGMALLQLADYFTVSNRAHAYTNVAIAVAAYEEYTIGLIEHLLVFKVRHWEKEMRTLTAQTLGLLTSRNTLSREYMRDVVLQSLLTTALSSNDLSEKHGSILCAAEVLEALHRLDPTSVSEALRMKVCSLVDALTAPSNQAQLNGRGGQLLREAICKLLESIARTRLLLTNSATLLKLRSYQAVLDENLAHTNEEVQNAAVRAVEQYARAYYLPSEGEDARASGEKLARAKMQIDHYIRTLGHPSSLAGMTRGIAAAIGTMPRAILVTTTVSAAEVYSRQTPTPAAAASATAAATSAPAAPTPAKTMPPADAVIMQPLSRLLQTLILSCTECAQPDAETRRNAVSALSKLMQSLSDDDLLQWMTPRPNPPPLPSLPAASSSSSSSSVTVAAPSATAAAAAASRDSAQKATAKLVKQQQELISKYWYRDLAELGLHGDRIFERVATALLCALDDYATDNRGDVGSWVREAAMDALEALLLKLARIQASLPDADIFPRELSRKAFPALLKQGMEKIDRVREKSGGIVQRLLWSSEPEVPFIPLRDQLRAVIPRPDDSSAAAAVDWSSPTQTFPLLTPLMALRSQTDDAPAVEYPYHRSLLSGLLISVGGLTESVVKSSSDALSAYVAGLTTSIGEEDDQASESLLLLHRLCDDLLAILVSEKGHARVMVPAFKTIELLLAHNIIDSMGDKGLDFARDLGTRVWKEVASSQNIHKVMAAIPVLVGLLSCPSPALRSSLLLHLLTLLGHATFPKIRRLTGESLYNALLISEEIVPGAEEDPDKAVAVLDVLTRTPWDGPLPQARAERDKLYPMLGLTKPALKAKSAGAAARPAFNADMSALAADYSTLVRDIGY